jgi:hypothetical protein
MGKNTLKSDNKNSKDKVSIEVCDYIPVVDSRKGKNKLASMMKKIMTNITSVTLKDPEKNK